MSKHLMSKNSPTPPKKNSSSLIAATKNCIFHSPHRNISEGRLTAFPSTSARTVSQCAERLVFVSLSVLAPQRRPAAMTAATHQHTAVSVMYVLGVCVCRTCECVCVLLLNSNETRSQSISATHQPDSQIN